MEFATGALGVLLPKLAQLLQGEYNLQKGVRKDIEFLTKELESIHAALSMVREVPREQLSKLVRIWARDARELSYDMEDVVDTFLVRVQGPDRPSKKSIRKFIKKMFTIVSKSTARHQIGEEIKDIKARVKEVADRRDRYKFDAITPATTTIDSRITALYTKSTDLVGINEAREELITLLSAQQQRIVSIVGFGGLGKTTLAKAVYDEFKVKFDCTAFVSVSQKPNMKNFFKNMLHELGRDVWNTELGEKQFIDLVRECLQNKRYFVIIDDIWDISSWEIIRCALPEGSDGCKIIATTRDSTVAGHIGGAYNMKPLSPEHSRTLMYGRIFGEEHELGCLDEHLVEVSDRILKKCAGVPLAIITIASLLASKGKNKSDWDDVCNSIGTGLEDNSTIENMRKVLSLSYYDMPSHLRTCLLYLSVFPEDYEIEKDRLIRLWTAEDFIQSGKQEKSLFEIGESYFNELINRSMIQPIYNIYCGMVEECRVHDMVLDLICSLSSEENFVTIWNDVGHTSASEKDRRLSLQRGREDHCKHSATISMEHVRSLIVFSFATGRMPALESFRVLRVLDLEGCEFSQGYNLNYCMGLLHLRYLSLGRCEGNDTLKGIEKLQFLQTLDLRFSDITILPSTIVQLRHLMCLRMTSMMDEVPKGIGSMTSLEELSGLILYDNHMDILKELSHLTELRMLSIEIMNGSASSDKSLVGCLNKLKKIRSLSAEVYSEDEYSLDGWAVTPRQLCSLRLSGRFWFSVLPAWVNPSDVAGLSVLVIEVRKLQQEDFEILGRLPSLIRLNLSVDHVDLGIHGRFVASAGSFQILENCCLRGFGGPVVFGQGAMPRLKLLRLEFQVWEMRKINGGFDLGLENLPPLRDPVRIILRFEDAHKEEAAEVEAALMHAKRIHPNYPTFAISKQQI